MTAKPETNFWKNLKTCLEDGNFLVSRIESYATPGFPDCVAFHKDTGFITLELNAPHKPLFEVMQTTNLFFTLLELK